MKIFTQAMVLVASMALAQAKTVYEMNAFVTPKRDSPNTVDPYLKENFLNLRESSSVEDDVPGHILSDLAAIQRGGDASRIVATSDIDNYFNL